MKLINPRVALLKDKEKSFMVSVLKKMSQLKSYASESISLLSPPILRMGIRAAFPKRQQEGLFQGNDSMFKSLLRDVALYGEYGCGSSTIWVSENTAARIISVDTSREWINKISLKTDPKRVKLEWIDCGPVGKWGMPVTYEKKHNFRAYAEALWRSDLSPHVTLIDGRFRILCFLISLQNARPGSRIVFDDFVQRGCYHVVKDVLEPVTYSGRQALFVVPEKSQLDDQLIENMIEKFEYVLE